MKAGIWVVVVEIHQWMFFGEEPPANAGNLRDVGSIPGSGRSMEEGMATFSTIIAWESHWQRSSAGYSPRGHEESDMSEVT